MITAIADLKGCPEAFVVDMVYRRHLKVLPTLPPQEKDSFGRTNLALHRGHLKDKKK